MVRRKASRKPERQEAARVRHLVALDAAQVVRRLRERAGEMVRLFSRTRDRAPLVEGVQSWFESVTFAQLAQLEPREQSVVAEFYEALGALRWYLKYTEDMPLQVRQHVAEAQRTIDAAHRRLTGVIGPADGHGGTVIEVDLEASKGR